MVIDMWIFWIIVAVVFAVLEMATGTFTLIWFTLGAVIASIFDVVNVSLYGQISVFLLVSLILVLFTRSFVSKFMNSKHTHKTNLDSIIGLKGTVIANIDALNGKGQVKVKGEVWTAVSTDTQSIEKGTTIVVDEIKGVTLLVSKSE